MTVFAETAKTKIAGKPIFKTFSLFPFNVR